MALTRTKPKSKLDADGNPIDEASVYTAIDAFCCGEHGRYVIARGHRLRGSAPAVQASSTLWLPDGADDADLAHARQRVWPDAP